MTTIHTEAFRRIEADETGFSVTCTSSDSTLEVALNADERRALADALVPGRDFSGVDWKTMFEHEIRNRVAAVALLRRERDEALRKKGEAFDRAVRAERERDEWKARAEAAGREREKIADQFATFRAEIVAEAVKARKSAVTRADIDRALIDVTSNAMNYPTPSQMLGKDTGPLRRKCVDAMCDLLGIEAEQVVDPVESKARELYRAVMPDARWETVADEYRRIAAHVIEQETDHE